MDGRKKYSEQFKQDAITLSEEAGVRNAAGDLGIDRSMLCQRRKAAVKAAGDGLPAFPGQGNRRDEGLPRLRKENAALREANEILKKAAAIFAQRGRRQRSTGS